MKAKVYVFSDSVLCVWEKRFNTWNQTPNGKADCRGSKVHYNTKTWVDSMVEPVEFEWKIFPGHTSLQILREIGKLMGEWDCAP